MADLISECIFTTSRSSGPGGQHVNKTETKVDLRFNIVESLLLSGYQKNQLLAKLKSKLVDNDTSFILTAQDTRSQLKNKIIVIKRFNDLITEMLKEDELRIATTATEASKEKRITSKKKSGNLKAMRGNLKNRKWEEP